MNRVHFLATARGLLMVAFLVLFGAIRPAAASSLAELESAARREGTVVWIESSPESQVTRIIQAFARRYPGIRVEQVRLRGEQALARIVTETRAGQPTADVVTAVGEGQLLELLRRGMVMRVDWRGLGVDADLIRGEVSVATAASIYVFVYNTNLVPVDLAPRSWEDLLHPRWKGKKIGFWIQPYALATLVPAWGSERTLRYAKALAAQDLVYYQSTFPLAAAVGSGEIPVGVGIYHAALPTLEAGAPIRVVFPDPTPITILNSWIPQNAAHPNAAKLFVRWLATPEGADIYEEATGRGNPFLAGTKTYKNLQGRQVAAFSFEGSLDEVKWLERVADTLGVR